jgi:uncharacterized membrane protein YozB (DUF420 family)
VMETPSHQRQRPSRAARRTAPVWLYLSITGVIVYFMCYRWYGPPLLP